MLNLLRIAVVLTLCLYNNAAFSDESETTSTTADYFTKQETLEMNEIDTYLLENLTEKERNWYHKFQNGLMFFNGWKQISADILSSLPNGQKPETQNFLEEMGLRIGMEWCKENSIRKIDTDQLRSWGNRLRKARKNGADNLSEAVRNIADEVDFLLENGSETADSSTS